MNYGVFATEDHSRNKQIPNALFPFKDGFLELIFMQSKILVGSSIIIRIIMLSMIKVLSTNIYQELIMCQALFYMFFIYNLFNL